MVIRCMDPKGKVIWERRLHNTNDLLLLVGHLNYLVGRLVEAKDPAKWGSSTIGGYRLTND